MPSLSTMAFLGLLRSVALAQTETTLALARADAMAPERFSLIKGVRELSDKRVIVSDWIEQRVVVVDFEAGTTRDLGRVGSGPSEFRLPSRLLALPEDSTLLLDYGNSRLTVIGLGTHVGCLSAVWSANDDRYLAAQS